jgi:ribosomal protein S6
LKHPGELFEAALIGVAREERLECMPLMESNRTGTIEQTINYPIVKKVLFGHLTGVDFENPEELLAKFPHIFTVNNTIIRLRVIRGNVVLGESTTQLS